MYIRIDNSDLVQVFKPQEIQGFYWFKCISLNCASIGFLLSYNSEINKK